MKVTPLALPDVLLIEPRVFTDDRGYFTEGWNSQRYAAAGVTGPFVQDNLSYSRIGVLRGLHFQAPGQSQGKLVSVLSGCVWDVAVDVRRNSSTFGRWVAEELSEENHRQLWIPDGFAHGFVVLSDHALFGYKVTAPYHPEFEVTIRWNEPRFAIAWPINAPVLSSRDAGARGLDEIPPDLLPLKGAPD